MSRAESASGQLADPPSVLCEGERLTFSEVKSCSVYEDHGLMFKSPCQFNMRWGWLLLFDFNHSEVRSEIYAQYEYGTYVENEHTEQLVAKVVAFLNSIEDAPKSFAALPRGIRYKVLANDQCSDSVIESLARVLYKFESQRTFDQFWLRLVFQGLTGLQAIALANIKLLKREHLVLSSGLNESLLYLNFHRLPEATQKALFATPVSAALLAKVNHTRMSGPAFRVIAQQLVDNKDAVTFGIVTNMPEELYQKIVATDGRYALRRKLIHYAPKYLSQASSLVARAGAGVAISGHEAVVTPLPLFVVNAMDELASQEDQRNNLVETCGRLPSQLSILSQGWVAELSNQQCFNLICHQLAVEKSNALAQEKLASIVTINNFQSYFDGYSVGHTRRRVVPSVVAQHVVGLAQALLVNSTAASRKQWYQACQAFAASQHPMLIQYVTCVHLLQQIDVLLFVAPTGWAPKDLRGCLSGLSGLVKEVPINKQRVNDFFQNTHQAGCFMPALFQPTAGTGYQQALRDELKNLDTAVLIKDSDEQKAFAAKLENFFDKHLPSTLSKKDKDRYISVVKWLIDQWQKGRATAASATGRSHSGAGSGSSSSYGTLTDGDPEAASPAAYHDVTPRTELATIAGVLLLLLITGSAVFNTNLQGSHDNPNHRSPLILAGLANGGIAALVLVVAWGLYRKVWGGPDKQQGSKKTYYWAKRLAQFSSVGFVALLLYNSSHPLPPLCFASGDALKVPECFSISSCVNATTFAQTHHIADPVCMPLPSIALCHIIANNATIQACQTAALTPGIKAVWHTNKGVIAGVAISLCLLFTALMTLWRIRNYNGKLKSQYRSFLPNP